MISSFLLEIRATVSKEFCFGDPDFCVCEDCHSERAARTRKQGPNVPPISVPAPAAIKHSRFSQVDGEKAAELAKGKQLKNTSCSTASGLLMSLMHG